MGLLQLLELGRCNGGNLEKDRVGDGVAQGKKFVFEGEKQVHEFLLSLKGLEQTLDDLYLIRK